MQDLTQHDRMILMVAIDRYVADIAKACEEDQGCPEGKPGTIGYELQKEYRVVRNKISTPNC